MRNPPPRPAAAEPIRSIAVTVTDPAKQAPAAVILTLPMGERVMLQPKQARGLAIILGQAANLADELQTIDEELTAADFGYLVNLALAQAGGQ